jgi:hypothetical protein
VLSLARPFSLGLATAKIEKKRMGKGFLEKMFIFALKKK